MKILLSFFVLVSLQVFAAAGDEPTGRYQLVAGTITTVGALVAPIHTLIRIDTKTGRTWVYNYFRDKDGKTTHSWVLIPDETLTGN